MKAEEQCLNRYAHARRWYPNEEEWIKGNVESKGLNNDVQRLDDESRQLIVGELSRGQGQIEGWYILECVGKETFSVCW